MQNTHSRWSSFFRLLLLIPTVGLASADVVITAGTASTSVTCCGPGSSSSGSFALQGAGLTLNTSGTSYDLLNVSGSAQTVAFDPASTQVYPRSENFPPSIKLVYNGVTYTDADFVTFSVTFAGSPVTVPNTVPVSPEQRFAGQVTNVPFTLTGTITVHSGSLVGPAILTIPISGGGVYNARADGTYTGTRPYIGTATYQFQPPSTTAFRMDRTTQGSWNGKYGTDGYLIPNGAQALPYATVTVTGAQTYTWVGLTTDPRALQNGPQASNRIASTFYGSNFNIDLNMTDGLTHQVAIYLLDWDTTTRTESITITDIATGALIDVQSFSGFNGGQYAIFNLKGRVRINVAAASAVVSGIFVDPITGGPPQQTLTLTASPVTIAPGSSGSSNISVNGFLSAVSFAASNWPAGITGIFGATATINVAANVAPGPYSLTVIGTSGSQTASTTIQLTVSQPVSSNTAAVTYIGSDTTTQGSWQGKFGADGYLIANGVSALPGYSGVNVTGASTFTWTPATTDPRALRTSLGSTTGLAASYHGNSFNIGVNLLDGATHRVALYLLDWENAGRQLTITITDAVTNAMLYQNNFAGFQNGQYPSWNIKGNVNINLTRMQGNAVFSGIFFGTAIPLTPGFTISATAATATAGSSTSSTVSVIPFNGFSGPVAFSANPWPTGITGTLTNTQPSTATIDVASSVAPGSYSLGVVGSNGPIITLTTIALTVISAAPANGPFAAFTGVDAATQGAWTGKYGGAGYLIANGAAKNPTFGSISVTGASTYTWAGQTTDPRALQSSPGAANRIASTYTQYPNISYSFNVAIADSAVHKLAVYLLDWDNANRTETIAILDAATGATLDSQTISSFNGGKYAVWNVRGNVTVKVTPASGTSALASGIFID